MTTRPDRIDLGDVSGAVTLGPSMAHAYTMVLTGNIAITAKLGGLGIGERVLLSLQQDGTGGHSVDWPDNVIVPPSELTMPLDPGGVLLCEFVVTGEFFDMWSAALHVIGSTAAA